MVKNGLHHKLKSLATNIEQEVTELLFQHVSCTGYLANFGKEEFVCKVAENLEEAKVLLESGYEYVTELDGVKLFRKRK